MHLDLDADDLVANEMFANVFAFLDSIVGRRDVIRALTGRD
jgi:hypothetical protein